MQATAEAITTGKCRPKDASKESTAEISALSEADYTKIKQCISFVMGDASNTQALLAVCSLPDAVLHLSRELRSLPGQPCSASTCGAAAACL
jgi:hypothetical protein